MIRLLGRRAWGAALTVSLLTFTVANETHGAGRHITVASTTSTENSGLFDHVLPLFETRTGISVRVIAKGTGQAIEIARRGDADVLLVHHRPSEEKFVAQGFGLKRREVMYNDFVIVGPRDDPADIGGGHDALTALRLIAASSAPFLSRGDESGTHRRELALWREAALDVDGAGFSWYREAGAGMGAALNIAAEAEAYILADRGTWLGFHNKRNLEILVEGDKRLINIYSVILVNPVRHPHVKAKDGRTFIEWLLSPPGQAAIAGFRIAGEQPFFPLGTTGAYGTRPR
ncbi:MAG: substrate-binding domain-containing protein [Sphingomonadales bacterium]